MRVLLRHSLSGKCPFAMSFCLQHFLCAFWPSPWVASFFAVFAINFCTFFMLNWMGHSNFNGLLHHSSTSFRSVNSIALMCAQIDDDNDDSNSSACVCVFFAIVVCVASYPMSLRILFNTHKRFHFNWKLKKFQFNFELHSAQWVSSGDIYSKILIIYLYGNLHIQNLVSTQSGELTRIKVLLFWF